jgi:hypothetical protein
MKHESLSGWWWIPECIPKRFKDSKQAFVPRWILPLGRSSIIDAGARIHVSVFARKAGGVGYAPSNISEDYAESQ